MKASDVQLQLELGMLPLIKEPKDEMMVVFKLHIRDRRIKKCQVRFGRIVSVSGNVVVVEDVSAPGSRHSRRRDEIWEVHVDTKLGVFG